MSKKPPEQNKRACNSGRPSLSARLDAVRYLNSSSARRTTAVQHIADALIAAGYTSLDEQARALTTTGTWKSAARAWQVIETIAFVLSAATRSRL
jgi:hypothetical protein